MTDFKPFDNDSQSTTVGPDNGLTFENGTEEINIYGDFRISKNSDLTQIDSLIEMLQNIKNNLIKEVNPEQKVKNQK